jgi:catechol 2,3-dioxygenase-like lactoylglutathione lyase family enzyme
VADFDLGWPNWIGVVTRDLEAQRRFYRDVLGLRELQGGSDWVWFDMGEGRLFELLELDPEQPQYDQVRYQAGFVVKDIGVAAKELVARDVEQVTDVQGGPESRQYWCYFRDPEGNLFEITQPL